MIYEIGSAPREFHHPIPKFVCLVRVAPRYRTTGDLSEHMLLINKRDSGWTLPSGNVNEVPVHAIRTGLEAELGILSTIKDIDFCKHLYVMSDDGKSYLYYLAQATYEDKPAIKMGDEVMAHMWTNKKAFIEMQLIPGEDLTLGDIYKS